MRAFRLAYDGTEFRGFQRQPHGQTVEDRLFDALQALGIDVSNGSPSGYAAAGRTDAGVSARAQTVAFETPEWLSPRALNSELPQSIRAWAVADVDAEFHATYAAATRTYRYFLYAPETEIDDDRAGDARRRLSGENDFHNFTPDATGTVRELSVSIERDGDFLVIDCRAGGFTRQLVRRIVSVVESVARGVHAPAFVDRALGSEPLSGPDGIAPAAPEPLVLLDVEYPGVEFTVDSEAFESTRETFDSRRRRRLATARVAGALARDHPS